MKKESILLLLAFFSLNVLFPYFIFAQSTQIYEAEDAKLSGVKVASNSSGFTGNGFADYINSANDYVEWTVNAPSSGVYTLDFRYALLSGSRPLQVKVNGEVIKSSLDFPSTGSWSIWKNVSMTANLVSGNNKIQATAIGSSGANIDSLKVTSTVAVPSPESQPVPTSPPNLGVQPVFTAKADIVTLAYPNQAKLEVVMSDVQNIGAYDYDLVYDTNLVTFVGVIHNNTFLTQNGNSNTFLNKEVSPGRIRIGVYSYGPAGGYTGSTTSETFTFSAKNGVSGGAQFKIEKAQTTEKSAIGRILSAKTVDSTVLVSLTQFPTSSPNPTVTPLPTLGQNVSLSLEAEKAQLYKAVVATNIKGYTGSGFVDYVNNTGDYIKWTVSVPLTGQYSLSFRYGLLSGNRPLELSVNDKVVAASLSFPATKSWSIWKNVVKVVNLQSGVNTIQLKAIGSSGANIDSLTVSN